MKNHNSEIAILLQQCKENNQKAQLKLYNMYYKAMFNVAIRIINDKTLAEEIMQDSFLKAFMKLDSYSGNVSFGAWLKKIVINTSINEFKKLNTYQFDSLNEVAEIIETNENEAVLWNKLKAEEIIKTMQSLKNSYKIILTLSFIEGYDLEEISTILNISNENCRTTMSRAKASLRKKLNAYEK
ncbi:RNA polymerase sigma factor [uncultured Flavobacterium sp.]|uniref:RNA polymerase sigma factor n=1 Tax=uncultured Flavobacterium sp. TaxID=165435 RepID=UPI0030CA382B